MGTGGVEAGGASPAALPAGLGLVGSGAVVAMDGWQLRAGPRLSGKTLPCSFGCFPDRPHGEGFPRAPREQGVPPRLCRWRCGQPMRLCVDARVQ